MITEIKPINTAREEFFDGLTTRDAIPKRDSKPLKENITRGIDEKILIKL
jgi:hypothetical protein